MTDSDYRAFFRRATGGQEPFPYQGRLAEGEWPDLLAVPTGAGKTAAVVLAWLWRRRLDSDALPRRLLWCLPTRALVAQVFSAVEGWLAALGLLGEAGEEGKVSLHRLMGGETAAPWAEYPEGAAVIVGTQDQLLSRALMRGYGMSRYQWPVHFALLHSDALWVFDEVQLMGAGIATSAQLEAFRRSMATARPSRSLWLSATLEADWLETVDFRPHCADLRRGGLNGEDRGFEVLARRLNARKDVRATEAAVDGATAAAQKGYLDALAAEVLATHQPGSNTLVILNQVARAQELAKRLRAAGADPLLLHGRFRIAERAAHEERLKELRDRPGRIIVATQAVEAGVDVSSRVLFTELAPWASLVQRFGRCNRYGEYAAAEVRWIDLGDEKAALPYEPQELAVARQRLAGMEEVGPAALAEVAAPLGERPFGAMLRRKDLLELFNTDPDLSGFDADVAPLIRDSGNGQLQVFWRDLAAGVENEPLPVFEELCTVSIGQLGDYLGGKGGERRAYLWDGQGRRWQPVTRPRPGMRLMLDARLGGYDPGLGFLPTAKSPVTVEHRPPDRRGNEAESYGGDASSHLSTFVTLDDHLGRVVEEARALAERVAPEWLDPLTTAARWHDAGKAHPAFQNMLLVDAGEDAAERQWTLWAKGIHGRGMPTYATCERTDEAGWGTRERIAYRLGFRHELASMLAWLAHSPDDLDPDSRDLIAYLIAAHHGKVRLGLRALPTELEPAGAERRFARGVWEGDRLPPMALGGGIELPETELRLELMMLGEGEGQGGPSWSARTHALLERLGPFRLAWLEALVRIADWRGSREDDQEEVQA